MWQKFTGRARLAIASAQDQAKEWGDPFVEPAHILLAITANEDSMGAQVLLGMGISLEEVAKATETRMPPRTGLRSIPSSLSDASQKVIDLCYEEARRLDDDFVGTEHLLLGIIRLDDGATGNVLRQLNVSLALTRAAVAGLHESEEEAESREPVPQNLLGKIKMIVMRLIR